MKTLTLIRTLYSEEATLGVLIDGYQNFICHILELPWKDNKQDISCIPIGDYICAWIPHEGGFRYAVHDVPGRSFIQIHTANEPSEILGCLVPGMDISGSGTYIYKSKVAINEIYERAGKEFMLRIREI